jgi:hypothetical protein
MGAFFDLFIMINMARVLVAEGYNSVHTREPGLVIRFLCFCSPDLSHESLRKQDSSGRSVGLYFIPLQSIK